MSKNVKVYYAWTQKDYDDLMFKLYMLGYKWANGASILDYVPIVNLPAIIYCRNYYSKRITIGFLGDKSSKELEDEIKKNDTRTKVIEYRAGGNSEMEKIKLPENVFKWCVSVENSSLRSKLNMLFDTQYGGLAEWRDSLATTENSGYEVAEDIITKVHFCGCEIEESLPQKYYWRKKSELFLDFEDFEDSSYEYFLNLDTETNEISFDDKGDYDSFITAFTEQEVRDLLGDDDFNKLEKVKI